MLLKCIENDIVLFLNEDFFIAKTSTPKTCSFWVQTLLMSLSMKTEGWSIQFKSQQFKRFFARLSSAKYRCFAKAFDDLGQETLNNIFLNIVYLHVVNYGHRRKKLV